VIGEEEQMSSKILVPLDGSTNAEKIIVWCKGIATALRSSLVLLTVVDPEEVQREDFGPGRDRPDPNARPQDTGSITGEISSGTVFSGPVSVARAGVVPPSSIPFGTQVIERACEDAKKYIGSVAADLLATGFEVSTVTAVGRPEDEILKVADQEKVGMITMATHRGSMVARGILGSVTDRVLRSSPIPVMTVHPGIQSGFGGKLGMPKVVIVPLNGSEISERAIEPALEIADAARSEVVFVQAIRPIAGSGVEYHYYDDSANREACLEYLSRFAEIAEKTGLRSRIHVLIGPPAIKIIEELQKHEGGMVVMSSHGSSGLTRWVVGSVADKVIRASRRPVLVIPPDIERE
jgi:nucleotide-binding universal stress UspA family protein